MREGREGGEEERGREALRWRRVNLFSIIMVQEIKGHVTGAHERAERDGASYSAYAGGTSFQPSSNSDKVLIWPTANFVCV